MSFIWQADLHDEEPPGSLRAATLGTDQLDPRQAVAGERPASLYLSTAWGWVDTEHFTFQYRQNPTGFQHLRSFLISFTRAVALGTDTHGSHTC